MAKIMVDAKLIQRPLGFNQTSTMNIEELEWCLDNSLTANTDVFLLIYGQKSQLYDIVRLLGVSPYDKSHHLYKVSSGQIIRVNEEPVLMKLMIFERKKTLQHMSNAIAINLKTDNYALMRQTAMARDLGLAIENYYQAIYTMYEDLKKGDTNNDN